MVSQRCQTCGRPKTEHGPELQCPCITWTDEGRFITWNKCTFQGLSVAEAASPEPTKEG